MSCFESSVLPKKIKLYLFGPNIIILCSVPVYIYWLILLLLQFFLLGVLLHLSLLTFSNLYIFLPSCSLFHVPYFHSVCVYVTFPVLFLSSCLFITFVSPIFSPLSFCLPVYVEYCTLLNFIFFIFFNFKKDIPTAALYKL
jgi:hypothetical protein